MPGRTAERSLETGTRVPEPSPQGAQEPPPGTEQRPPHTYTVRCTRCSRLVSVGGRLGLRLALTTNTRGERSGAVTQTSIDRTPLTEVRAHAASAGHFSTARFGEWPPRARGAETDRRTDLPLDVGALPSSSMLRDLTQPGRTWTSTDITASERSQEIVPAATDWGPTGLSTALRTGARRSPGPGPSYLSESPQG